MAKKKTPDDDASADHISFNEFQQGLPLGRFHVVVNPELARPFVSQRVNAVQIGIAIVGIGIACALAGYLIAGALLIAGGILFRRVIKRQAPAILLQLASRQAAAYEAATAEGVMEVQRRRAS